MSKRALTRCSRVVSSSAGIMHVDSRSFLPCVALVMRDESAEVPAVARVTLCCDVAGGGDWDGDSSVRELSFSAAEGPILGSFSARGSGGLVLKKESVILRGWLLLDCIAA